MGDFEIRRRVDIMTYGNIEEIDRRKITMISIFSKSFVVQFSGYFGWFFNIYMSLSIAKINCFFLVIYTIIINL